MRPNSKKALLMTCIVFWAWAIFWIVIGIPSAPEPTVTKDIAEAFFSTCQIDTVHGTGTGILLNTGFVLTAAHVIDVNNNSKVDANERKVTLTFFSEHASREFEARAISCGSSIFMDVAILQPERRMKSKIRLSLGRTLIGEKVFSIGCQKALPPHVSFGVKSRSVDIFSDRTSINSYMGASGSAVFNEDQEVIGILDAVGADKEVHVHSKIPFHYTSNGKRKKRTLTGHIDLVRILPNWSTYMRSDNAYTFFSAKNLGFALIPEEPYSDNRSLIVYFRMLLQIMGVLACVAFFRREILGKTLS